MERRKSRKRGKWRRRRQFPGGVDSNGGVLGKGSSSGIGDRLVYRMGRRNAWKRGKCRRLFRFLTGRVDSSGREFGKGSSSSGIIGAAIVV